MRNILLFLLSLALFSCASQNSFDPDAQLQKAAQQYAYMASEYLAGQPDCFPRTFENGEFKSSNSGHWCSGFYPGTLFYLYEATGNEDLKSEGERILQYLEKEQYNTHTHDVGFMMGCSFGNADRIDHQEHYDSVLVQSAKSLITRFNPTVGCIRSWDRKDPSQFIVIIDNMMNLELLFKAAELTGDKTFYDIAVTHADTTLKYHYRPDGAALHVLNYDPVDGHFQNNESGQGYSTSSVWSRGNAWGLYGFTLAYRCTNEQRFLDRAVANAEYMLNNPTLPEDLIPLWDYDAAQVPDSYRNPASEGLPEGAALPPTPAKTMRDASAAAINCSALLELCKYVPEEKSERYFAAAESILKTLSSEEYNAQTGTNGGFILKHGVGNLPYNSEVEVPLTYADYYYVEALMRYKALKAERAGSKG